MQNIAAEDFYKPTPYNQITKNQIWMSQIQDSHDNFCDCGHSYAHLLASIFPPGHQDRNLTIQAILERDYTEKCRSGGGADASLGLAGGGEKGSGPIKEEDIMPEDDVEDLLAAAAAIEEKER